MHRQQLILPAAAVALAIGLLAAPPVQGRFTQGSAAAPAPRTEVLGVDQQPPARAVWVSQPLDARGYHSVTVNLTTSADRTRVEGVRLLGRNSPNEAWCVIAVPAMGASELSFGSGREQAGRTPLRGASYVVEGLHSPEIAVEVVAGHGPRASSYAVPSPGEPFTVSAYLE